MWFLIYHFNVNSTNDKMLGIRILSVVQSRVILGNTANSAAKRQLVAKPRQMLAVGDRREPTERMYTQMEPRQWRQWLFDVSPLSWLSIFIASTPWVSRFARHPRLASVVASPLIAASRLVSNSQKLKKCYPVLNHA